MIRRIISLLFLFGFAAVGFSQTADVVYVDGWVDIKAGGDQFEARAGDMLRTGDSIITGDDSYAELEQKSLSTITVKPNSIFMLQEREGESGKETVLSTTVGSVSFKFGKLFGREPAIATPSMTAGVRGTEFTVYAAEDGTSLVAVTSGLVTVSSRGASVDLAADEGVEVKAGEAPGEKFKLKGRELDFSTWNSEKYNALVSDPVKGLEGLSKQIDSFIADIKDYSAALYELKDKRETLRKKWNSLKDAGKEDEAKAFYKENILPMDLKIGPVFLNIRYYSLSALSFRRYILGKLYVDLKGRYFADPSDPVYREFLDQYRAVLGKFEKDVVPFLDVNDI